MTAVTTSAALVPVQPLFTDTERIALAGFLAGYRGLTREAYTLDLRQFTTWCRARSLPLSAVRRAGIGAYARGLEDADVPGLPLPGGCAPSPGSAGRRSRKSCLSIPRPRTSAVPAWTTSPMPSPSTATSLVPCSSRPGSGYRPSTR